MDIIHDDNWMFCGLVCTRFKYMRELYRNISTNRNISLNECLSRGSLLTLLICVIVKRVKHETFEIESFNWEKSVCVHEYEICPYFHI